jgi:phosphotransferase system enzyme I (PtsP)
VRGLRLLARDAVIADCDVGAADLHLLLPMLTLTSELQEARILIERARAGLEEDGQPANLPPVGIMVEVPAAVFRIDELAAKADFVSIGTNDLTQYLLATDRANPYVGKMCDPLTPAVLDALGMVAEGARRQGIAVSVGGELAGDPLGALLLLGLGVDALSMAPGSIGRVKQVVRTFSAGQAGDLWRDALRQESAERVREMLEHALEEKGFSSLWSGQAGKQEQGRGLPGVAQRIGLLDFRLPSCRSTSRCTRSLRSSARRPLRRWRVEEQSPYHPAANSRA